MLRYLEKVIMLQSIDHHWKDHLLAIDQLKEGIGLRGYGRRTLGSNIKKKPNQMFLDMLDRIKKDTVEKPSPFRSQGKRNERNQDGTESRLCHEPWGGGPGRSAKTEDGKGVTVRREGKKVGRNDPCPCGSGKKYKRCCLPKEEEARA